MSTDADYERLTEINKAMSELQIEKDKIDIINAVRGLKWVKSCRFELTSLEIGRHKLNYGVVLIYDFPFNDSIYITIENDDNTYLVVESYTKDGSATNYRMIIHNLRYFRDFILEHNIQLEYGQDLEDMGRVLGAIMSTGKRTEFA